ncbi:uncharacterized protein EI90DRAFT_2605730 [Cantharellus anzutake]|uniref:uncharacterized protein n=1 Tax=Cantharellus anzutake TaxID=1750568 RepID=UPI00190433CE|nr:uncharacterized protein EI90DRAFT_2605730 [Cantharellus anzutake]KAF8320597.1 hypothetical protein EI90DRAFT_2605730 [Cantharellus anzutake]
MRSWQYLSRYGQTVGLKKPLENFPLLRGILRCIEWTQQLRIVFADPCDPADWAVRYNTVAEFILIFRKSHFPRLTELICDCHTGSSALRALPCWLSPELLKLELRVDGTDAFTSLILRTLHEYTPRLTSLSVCFGDDESISHASHDLSSTLNALTQLQVFKAQSSLVLEPGVWKELASLPNLRSVDILSDFECLGHRTPKKFFRYWHADPAPPTVDVDDPFPTLESIDGDISADLVPKIFGMRGICKLRHLKLVIQDAPSELTIQTIFQTIPAYYNQLETFSVKLKAWEAPRHDLTTFVFERLKTFSLWTTKPFVIAPDAFLEFTQRHPGLLSLTLTRSDQDTKAGFPPDIVPRILEACPSLGWLHINLQGSCFSMHLSHEDIQKLRAEQGLQLDVKQA